MKPSFTSPVFVSLIALVGCVANAPDDTEPGLDEDGEIDDADVEFEDEDKLAGPTFEQSDAVHDGSRIIDALATASPEQFSGARLDGDDLVVALPDGDDAGEREQRIRDELAADAGTAALTVRFERVANSRADLETMRAALRERVMSGELADKVVGIGTDPSRGVLVVYAGEATHELRKALKRELSGAVVFRRGEQFTFSSRSLDVAPHFGGAGYGLINSAGTSMRTPHCSTAFPVEVGGKRYMLTAGHCIPATDYTWTRAWAEADPGSDWKYNFGTRSMSVFPYYAGQYGDWALLEGSTYKARVYETNTTAVDVAAVDWGMPSVNEQFCRSGRTTGKLCRLIVVDPDFEAQTCDYYGNCRWVVKLVKYRSDQNLDGINDCNIGKGGDSGGAMFQWTGSKFRAMGIMTGTSTNGTTGCNDDRGVYTRLSGPKAWFPTMTMPVIP